MVLPSSCKIPGVHLQCKYPTSLRVTISKGFVVYILHHQVQSYSSLTFCLHFQHDIAKARDDAQHKYEEETPVESRSASGLRATINVAKKAKLNTPFTKYLAIANPNNGVSFLLELWSSIPTLVEFVQ